MAEGPIKVSAIEIRKMTGTQPYMRPFSKLEVEFHFSDSHDYETHRRVVEEALTKVIPNSRTSSSCEYGGIYIRQDVSGTEKRTPFSITDTSSTPRGVLVQCYRIKPELAREYISKVVESLKATFKDDGIRIEGENLLYGKS